MSGIKKEDIKINTYDKKVDIKTEEESAQRKYNKILDLPKTRLILKQQGLLTITVY